MAGNPSLEKRQEPQLKPRPVPGGVRLWCCCLPVPPCAVAPAAAVDHLCELWVFNVTHSKFRAWNETRSRSHDCQGAAEEMSISVL